MNIKQKNNLQTYFLIAHFVILFFGLRYALEEYLFEDELPTVYILAIAFICGILAMVLNYLMKDKSIKFQIIGTIIILTGILFLDVFIHYG